MEASFAHELLSSENGVVINPGKELAALMKASWVRWLS
jgi:hypothetical protein